MTRIRDVVETTTVPTFSTLVELLKRSSINPEVYTTRRSKLQELVYCDPPMYHSVINTITWARGEYGGMFSVRLAKVSRDGEDNRETKNWIFHICTHCTAVGGWGSVAERMLSQQQQPPVRINMGISNESTECLRCIHRLHPQNRTWYQKCGCFASHIQYTRN